MGSRVKFISIVRGLSEFILVFGVLVGGGGGGGGGGSGGRNRWFILYVLIISWMIFLEFLYKIFIVVLGIRVVKFLKKIK